MSELGLEVLFDYARKYEGLKKSSSGIPPSIVILFNSIYERGFECGRVSGLGEARDRLEEFMGESLGEFLGESREKFMEAM